MMEQDLKKLKKFLFYKKTCSSLTIYFPFFFLFLSFLSFLLMEKKLLLEEKKKEKRHHLMGFDLVYLMNGLDLKKKKKLHH